MKAKWALVAAGILAAMPVMARSQIAAQGSINGKISGDYMEFRNADVYTGPCFANSEVGLSGQNAVLAWHVADGEWAGVPLDGLSVAAVVRANATLGDPYGDPLPAKTVFFVDERATEAQRAALVSFAQAQAGGLLNDVAAIASAPISFAADSGRMGFETLAVGNIVKLSTRALVMTDMICHNEEVYYQPLAGHLEHAMPVVESESSYQGGSLGVTWNEAGRRSSFVGKFAE
ncbi:MAG TPA: DUF1326 domain-containing protein [Candidatus Acidoferrales bacterium]|nr:DUF1326 domain-containing protein [Candidatus Acidoferrales bacterium]